MPHRGALGGHITAQRRKDRGDGSTDVAAQDEGAGEVECYPALAAHDKHDGECGCRRLDNHGENHAHKAEYQHRAHAQRGILPQVGKHLGIALKVGYVGTDHIQAHEKEREADEKLADVLCLALVHKQKHYSQGDDRQHKGRNAYFKTEEGDNPRSESSADIGAENHGHRLSQRHKAGVYKTYHHHRRGRRTLNQRRDGTSGEQTGEAVAGHCRENVAQAVAGGFLEPLAHHFHTVEEESYGAEET